MRVAAFVAALWTLSLAGCGNAPGEATGSVGPRGGTVCVEDRRICLDVPSGALENEVGFRIQLSSTPAPGAIGDTWDIGPTGTTFLSPARVAIRYDLVPDAGNLNPALLRVYTEQEGEWVPLLEPSLDRVASTVKGGVLHLSPFAIRRIDLLPDGGIPPEPDGGQPDAGQARPDAGVPDAGRPDAGVPDAGRPDAGTPDAGRPDAGMPDAGFDAGMDAGVDAGAVDAGVDAGESDAGFDAGEADAGAIDGGAADGGS
ncbi:MAG: hypothetical protein ACOZIN_00545 [Myxococcota bacterium]